MAGYNKSNMDKINAHNEGERYAKMFEKNDIRYTIVHHPVRLKFGLTMADYAVVDSVDQLSNTDKFPYCQKLQDRIGKFLGYSRQTVSTGMKKGSEKGLLEKNSKGEYRTTMKWKVETRTYNRDSEEAKD